MKKLECSTKVVQLHEGKSKCHWYDKACVKGDTLVRVVIPFSCDPATSWPSLRNAIESSESRSQLRVLMQLF